MVGYQSYVGCNATEDDGAEWNVSAGDSGKR
ncbi:hypothetical protein HRbin24_01358 [bacterium HR24]|nr:hypothetical protein HRbin24_01358 [bacterium HR24]